MKNNIIKAEDLPRDENVYLKKSMGDWRVIKPLRNEDGTFNYFNFFYNNGFKNLFRNFKIKIIKIK